MAGSQFLHFVYGKMRGIAMMAPGLVSAGFSIDVVEHIPCFELGLSVLCQTAGDCVEPPLFCNIAS